jgi:hypothetical protein
MSVIFQERCRSYGKGLEAMEEKEIGGWRDFFNPQPHGSLKPHGVPMN